MNMIRITPDLLRMALLINRILVERERNMSQFNRDVQEKFNQLFDLR